MTHFEFSDTLTPNQREVVEVRDTQIGKGMFALRCYPAGAVVGEIRGELIHSTTHGSSYTFEFDEGISLEPFAPFRYVNHSCNPNCEFELIEDPPLSASETPKEGDASRGDTRNATSEDSGGTAGEVVGQPNRLYLVTLRVVEIGDQFSIDYNWTAHNAIRCQCGAVNCRGWVVSEDELSKLTQ